MYVSQRPANISQRAMRPDQQKRARPISGLFSLERFLPEGVLRPGGLDAVLLF